jgi:hypothetical protein
MSKTLIGWLGILFVIFLAFCTESKNPSSEESSITSRIQEVYADTPYIENKEDIPVLIADETWYRKQGDEGGFKITTYSDTIATLLMKEPKYAGYNLFDLIDDGKMWEFYYSADEYSNVELTMLRTESSIYEERRQ